jgi:hypothetical protein
MEIVFLAEKRNAPVLPVVGKSCKMQPWVESASACETGTGHAGSLVGTAIRLYALLCCSGCRLSFDLSFDVALCG